VAPGEIIEAPTRREAKLALELFRDEYGAKYPRALGKFDRDWTQPTTFEDCPAEQCRHLRTTNPIDSAFATVRLRTRVTKSVGLQDRGDDGLTLPFGHA
jgi:putative transposase